MNDTPNWIEQLRRGDNAAYDLLLAKFEGSLYRFFYCEHRNHQLAEEQSAETFMQLVRSLPKMRGDEDQLAGFIYGIARHIKFKRYRNSKESQRSVEGMECVDSAPTPAECAELDDDLSQLLHAVGALEPMVRQVILLRYVEDQSIAVIAHALRMPEGTVKSHIHRGKQRLRELLEDWNDL